MYPDTLPRSKESIGTVSSSCTTGKRAPFGPLRDITRATLVCAVRVEAHPARCCTYQYGTTAQYLSIEEMYQDANEPNYPKARLRFAVGASPSVMRVRILLLFILVFCFIRFDLTVYLPWHTKIPQSSLQSLQLYVSSSPHRRSDSLNIHISRTIDPSGIDLSSHALPGSDHHWEAHACPIGQSRSSSSHALPSTAALGGDGSLFAK